MPSDISLRLEFTEALRLPLEASSFRVEVGQVVSSTALLWNELPVADVRLDGARTVEVNLERGTQLASSHRISISGLVTEGSGLAVPDATVFFRVRSGEWGELQLTRMGGSGGVASGLILFERFGRLTSLETVSSIFGGGTAWGVATLESSPLSNWGTPRRFYRRLAEGFGEQNVQLQTGRFLIEDDIGLVRFNESSFGVPDFENDRNTLRAAVGLYIQEEDYLAGTYEAGDPLGLQFGPLVQVSQTSDDAGRVDKPGAPELGEAHFSYNG
ncbi:MAG: hypothetical protein AAGG01_11075 [Planctomycetota bacterium]